MRQMQLVPGGWRHSVWFAGSLGVVLLELAFVVPPLAAAGSDGGGCGVVAVHVVGRSSYWSVNTVSATGVSCGTARGLVRGWAVAAADGRIPGRVTAGKVNARGVIVYGQFGPSWVFRGYVCRWMNVSPGPHAGYLPGRGDAIQGGRW
jgi:hypothetical protein